MSRRGCIWSRGTKLRHGPFPLLTFDLRTIDLGHIDLSTAEADTMSRLASLQSTPSRRSSPSPSPSPAQSPMRPTETTHHRMLKMVLAEVRNVLSTWDGIVTHDGLKAGKSCIDEATEME